MVFERQVLLLLSTTGLFGKRSCSKYFSFQRGELALRTLTRLKYLYLGNHNFCESHFTGIYNKKNVISVPLATFVSHTKKNSCGNLGNKSIHSVRHPKLRLLFILNFSK